MGLPTFFFPPPQMALSEAKHHEGNFVLGWYFRGALYKKNIGSLQDKFIFFFRCGHILMSYGLFLLNIAQ